MREYFDRDQLPSSPSPCQLLSMSASRSLDTSEPPTKRARVEADAEHGPTQNGGSIQRVAEDQKIDVDFDDEDDEEEGSAMRRRRKAAVAGASQPSDMYLDTVMWPGLTTVASSHVCGRLTELFWTSTSRKSVPCPYPTLTYTGVSYAESTSKGGVGSLMHMRMQYTTTITSS